MTTALLVLVFVGIGLLASAALWFAVGTLLTVYSFYRARKAAKHFTDTLHRLTGRERI